MFLIRCLLLFSFYCVTINTASAVTSSILYAASSADARYKRAFFGILLLWFNWIQWAWMLEQIKNVVLWGGERENEKSRRKTEHAQREFDITPIKNNHAALDTNCIQIIEFNVIQCIRYREDEKCNKSTFAVLAFFCFSEKPETYLIALFSFHSCLWFDVYCIFVYFCGLVHAHAACLLVKTL